LKGEYQVYSKL